MEFNNFLLKINPKKEIRKEYISGLIEKILENGCIPFILKSDIDNLDGLVVLDDKIMVTDRITDQKLDCCIVLGGDGSIIRTSKEVSRYGIPLIGINFGKVGYLANIDDLDYDFIGSIKSGNYVIEERIMLGTKVIKGGRTLDMPPALNDIVLSNGSVAKILKFDIYCDDNLLEECRADGIIIATPTGSTAYSLSAGGPIVDPLLDVICLTPICPHSLNNRPIIIGGNTKIRIMNIRCEEKSSSVSVDGSSGMEIEPDDEIEIRKSEETTKLIVINNHSMMNIINSKLI